MTKINEKILFFRQKNDIKLTQKAIAEIGKVTLRTFQGYEAGKIPQVIKFLLLLKKRFGKKLDLNWLFDDSQPAEPVNEDKIIDGDDNTDIGISDIFELLEKNNTQQKKLFALLNEKITELKQKTSTIPAEDFKKKYNDAWIRLIMKRLENSDILKGNARERQEQMADKLIEELKKIKGTKNTVGILQENL